MNYNSIEDIFSAGTDNMEVLVENVGYDNNSYSVAAPDWLRYNGADVETVYVNGNSWFGLGSETEHLNVNRRDSKLWYLYREEGLLYNNIRFLKLRWMGYSRTSYTTDAYRQEYDVVFWDTGDISVHMVDVPTSYFTGTFTLTAAATLTYTKPTAASPDVTFRSQNADNTAFTYESILITLEKPYLERYLIRSSGTLYTVTDGVLTALTETALTAQIFADYGVEEIPAGELLLPLADPEVLAWSGFVEDGVAVAAPEGGNEPIPLRLHAVQTAVPYPQILYTPDYDMTHESILGIEKVEAVSTDGCIFAVSFDGGISWKSWTGTGWGILSEDTTGMTAATLAAITAEQWAMAATTGKYRFRLYLPTVEDTFTSITVDYINQEES